MSKEKRAMTLNLSVRDMDALNMLSVEMDMDKTTTLRMALRMFQNAHVRVMRGERMMFFDGTGKNVTTLNDVMPMQYIPPAKGDKK